MDSKAIFILGLDIGGANTKSALIKFKNQQIIEQTSYIEYFPFWQRTIAEIPEMLNRIVNNILINNNYSLNNVDYIGVTITAEISDAFQTKREGIITILSALSKIFDPTKLYFISNKNTFINFDQARIDYYSIAAANWISTSLYLGNFISNCTLLVIRTPLLILTKLELIIIV